MNRSEYTLIFLLRLAGSFQMLAIFAIFLPIGTMDSMHRMLGLGGLPTDPIVEYLARSLSAFYAIHGGLMWCLSSHVDRFRPIVILLASCHIALGLLLFGIDIMAGLPGYWVWLEGPSIVLGSTLMLALAIRGGRGA